MNTILVSVPVISTLEQAFSEIFLTKIYFYDRLIKSDFDFHRSPILKDACCAIFKFQMILFESRRKMQGSETRGAYLCLTCRNQKMCHNLDVHVQTNSTKVQIVQIGMKVLSKLTPFCCSSRGCSCNIRHRCFSAFCLFSSCRCFLSWDSKFCSPISWRR